MLSPKSLPAFFKFIYLDISNIPFRVAIPKSVIKPIIDGMLITFDEALIANIPPSISALSTFFTEVSINDDWL